MPAVEIAPQDEALVDAIYEAAMLPERWPAVLDRLAALAGCRTAAMIATNGTTVDGWIGNAASADAMATYLRGGWMAGDPTFARAAARGGGDFARDHDLFGTDEIDNAPLYRDFRRPSGLGWLAATIIADGMDLPILMAVHRPYGLGRLGSEAISRLNRLRPDLARAARLAAQLRREQAHAAVTALERLGLPAAALGSDGRARAVNDLFRALPPQVAIDRPDRLAFADQAVDRQFRRQIEANGHQGGTRGLTLPVPASDAGEAMVVHLAPLADTPQDVFGAARWLLVCARVGETGGVDPALLQNLFGLTPAEVRVARGLASGETLSDLAAHHGLGRETLRSQLKSVMLKTRTHRQADLVRLLTGMSRLSWA